MIKSVEAIFNFDSKLVYGYWILKPETTWVNVSSVGFNMIGQKVFMYMLRGIIVAVFGLFLVIDAYGKIYYLDF